MGFRDGSDSKESAHNEGDPGSIPGSGRSPGFDAQLSLCNNRNTHKEMNYRENFCVSSARTEHKHLTEPAVEITSFHSAQDSQPPSNHLLFQSVYYFKMLLMTFCTLNCKHQPGNYYP